MPSVITSVCQHPNRALKLKNADLPESIYDCLAVCEAMVNSPHGAYLLLCTRAHGNMCVYEAAELTAHASISSRP